jgi:ribosomal protein S18 acetylase RimI-like enzyme
MILRTADADDAPAIAALHAASWSQTYADELSPAYLRDEVPAERLAVWQRRFANPRANQHVLVVQAQADVVGFACVLVAEDPEWGSYLDNLHVAAAHQGRRLGAALLAAAAAASERHRPGLGFYLSVNQSNRRAQAFYQAMGARNAACGVWQAPDGSAVPTYRFAWPSATPLAARAGLTAAP